MKPNYNIHEEMYVEARQRGWAGWGGDKRIANAGSLVSRYLDVDFPLPMGSFLELGCGEGCYSRLFTELGFKVTGVDISETAISWAKEKCSEFGVPGIFFVVDLTVADLQFPEQYNVVIDGNCLHCIIGSDRAKFLSNVYNALASNGVFFVSSLCSKTEQNEVIEQYGVQYRHIAGVRSLIKELEQAGFRILKTVVHERAKNNHVNIHALRKETQ